MKVGSVYDNIYLQHDTGQHPESIERLEAILSHLEKTGLKQKLVPVKPRAATFEELVLIHEEQYIAYVRDLAQNGGGLLDPDTVISPGSYEAAIYAVGGVMSAVEVVMRDKMNSAFALIRPPGHHALHEQAMGFCLFNNVAVTAKQALAYYGLERILIVDFDVHHGNGTQAAFYDDPHVLYISAHEYPFYPGTGNIKETGSGKAEGATINIPLPAGSSDSEYLEVFEQIIVPATMRFEPQLILVSAGYDAHWKDELALMRVSITGFSQMVKIIKDLGDELCKGHLVLSLEGGYNLDALAASVRATFDVLLGNTAIEDPMGQPSHLFETPGIAPLLANIKETHRLS